MILLSILLASSGGQAAGCERPGVEALLHVVEASGDEAAAAELSRLISALPDCSSMPEGDANPDVEETAPPSDEAAHVGPDEALFQFGPYAIDGAIAADWTGESSDLSKFDLEVGLRRSPPGYEEKLGVRVQQAFDGGSQSRDRFLIEGQRSYPLGAAIGAYGLARFERDGLSEPRSSVLASGGMSAEASIAQVRLGLEAGPGLYLQMTDDLDIVDSRLAGRVQLDAVAPVTSAVQLEGVSELVAADKASLRVRAGILFKLNAWTQLRLESEERRQVLVETPTEEPEQRTSIALVFGR